MVTLTAPKILLASIHDPQNHLRKYLTWNVWISERLEKILDDCPLCRKKASQLPQQLVSAVVVCSSHSDLVYEKVIHISYSYDVY